MCLDKQCCHRALFEQTTLVTNDVPRLAGFSNEIMGKRFNRHEDDKLDDEMVLSRRMLELLPTPIYPMNALYSAVQGDNLAAIRKIGEMKVNPNVKQRDTGFTALHIAATQGKADAVLAIIDAFPTSLVANPVDFNGNTPLHLASMKGYPEVVSILCDLDQCDPVRYVNKKGETALDLARTHEIFQYISCAILKRNLEKELKEAKALP